MRARGAVALMVVGALAVACSSNGDDDPASTSSAPEITAHDTPDEPGATQTTLPEESPTTMSEVIPPLTPPANQAAACVVLQEAAFPGVALDPDALVPDDRPDGQPAPSMGCRFEAPDGPDLGLRIYYGIDPLEILAVVRQQSPAGTDLTGVGADAYYVANENSLYVDTGSRAFVVTGAVSQQDLEDLARAVIDNL